MDSLTKRRVTAAELATLVDRGFGPGAVVVAWHEITDGSYNAAYAVTVADGGTTRDLVLKVAPPPHLKLLTHEVDLMRTEVDVYERGTAAGVPLPEVVVSGFDRSVLGTDYVFLGRVPGTSLDRVAELTDAERATARGHAAALVARLHTVTGPGYGYPLRGSNSWRASWRAAFGAMVDDLIADADRLCGPSAGGCGARSAPSSRGVPAGWQLPAPTARIRALMLRHADALDEVRRPALVHFDLWDGNIFVDRGPGGRWRVTGLIDGERAFYGDPVAELASMVLGREPEEAPEVLVAFGHAASGAARRRLDLYRTYLYLIMAIEGRTRGWDDDRPWVTEALARLLDSLAAGPAGR